MKVPDTAAWSRRRGVLASGPRLRGATWRTRHAWLVGVLCAHLAVVAAVAVVGVPGAQPGLALLPAAGALGVAASAPRRWARSLGATAGLIWCSGVLVVATGGAAPAHAHAVLVVLALTLYEDWVPVLLGVSAGVLGYGVVGQLAPVALFGPAALDAPAFPALALGMALLVVVAALLGSIWWQLVARAGAGAQQAARRLAEREGAVAAQLEAAETLKSQLLAIVSHEFRTPLASITGLARTLSARMDGLDREAVQACLGGIDHHAGRLARLVNNIVATSGDVDVDPTAVTDLGGVTRDAIAEALEAHRRRVDVHVDLPVRFEAAVNPIAARHILTNLCDNAVKFAPRGARVEVSGTCTDGTAVVELANAADGLSDALLEHCFEPFVQADSSDTRPVEGIGLGLHVARRVARAHGGDLCARVRDGWVVFRLRLPAPGRLCVGAGEVRLELVPDDETTRVR